jgi:hypothetical protein
MLAFTRHPYLQLSAACLPFWVDILREAGILPGGLSRPAASAIAGGGGGAGGAAAGGAAAGGGGAAGGAGGAPQALEAIIPTECCRVRGWRVCNVFCHDADSPYTKTRTTHAPTHASTPTARARSCWWTPSRSR